MSHTIKRKKNRPKTFLHWKECLFLRNFFLFTSQVLQKLPCNFHSICPNYLVNPHKSSPRVWHTRYCEKKRPKSFLHWQDFLFVQSFLFSTNYVLKKWSYNFHSVCETTFWNFINRSLRFLTLDSARKNRRKTSLHWADCLFFSKVCVFNNLIGFTEISSNFHSKCQNTSWTPINCQLRFVTLDKARKNRPKSFLHWKVCLFFSKLFVFNNFLDVTQIILQLPQ